MRGHAHSIQGLAAGLAVAELPALFGHPVTVSSVIAFGVLTAGAVLLSDLDTPTSTAARMLGRASMILARRVGNFSSAVYASTRTPADPKRWDGHRGITHTLVAALAAGAVAGVFGWWAGAVGVAVASVALILLARRALFGRARRHSGIWRLVVPVAFVCGLLWLARHFLPAGPTGALLLGGAVALGMLVHDLGDALTKDGVPLFWPLKIKKQRWYRVRLLKKHAVKLGGLGEWTISAALIVAVAFELAPLLLG